MDKYRRTHILAGGASFVATDGSAFVFTDPFERQIFYSSDGKRFQELKIHQRTGTIGHYVLSFENPENGETGEFQLTVSVITFSGVSYAKNNALRIIDAVHLPGGRVPLYLFRRQSGEYLYVSSGDSCSYTSFRLFTGDSELLEEIPGVRANRLHNGDSTYLITGRGTLSVPHNGPPTWKGIVLTTLELVAYEIDETDEGVRISQR